MASVSAYAGAAADDATVGANSWSSLSNAVGPPSGSVYALSGNNPPTNPSFTSVRLVIAGTISGSNLASGSGGHAGPITSTFGGSSTLWGLMPLFSDINASNFGVVISLTGATQSHYISLSNYGFSIPSAAIINGITMSVTTDSNNFNTFLQGVQLQITYTLGSLMTNISSITGINTVTF